MDSKEDVDSPAALAREGLLVFLVNLGKREFLDTQGHEVHLVLTDFLEVQGDREM